MIERNKKNIKKTPTTSYILVCIFLILAGLSVFIDLEVIKEKYFKHYNNSIITEDAGDVALQTHQDDIHNGHVVIPQAIQEDVPEDLSKNNLDIHYFVDLSNMILDIYSGQDVSKDIQEIKKLLENDCPDEIKTSIEFVENYNQSLLDHKESNVEIFPKNNSFLEKILSPIIKIEKLNIDEVNNKEMLAKHLRLITEYSIELQRSVNND